MALITCPECGSQISDKATQCPKCGCPVENALQNAEKEQESEKKQHVSEIVEEQERIISHLEKSAEEETKSVVEKQKEIISKLEEEKANDFKSKRTNLGKYLFYGILFCILLIGGYFLLNSNEKKDFDSSMGLKEPTTMTNADNASIDNIRDENMELNAMSNYSSYLDAITTTGVVLDFSYLNDSIRLFIKGDYEYYRREEAKFMAYFFNLNDTQDFYSCNFVEVESPEGTQYADFKIYDTKNNYIGDLCVCLQTTELMDGRTTIEVSIIKQRDYYDVFANRILFNSKQEDLSIFSPKEDIDEFTESINQYDILEIDNNTPFNIVKWKTDFNVYGDFWFSEKENLITDGMRWTDGTSPDLGYFTFHRFNNTQYTCTYLRDSKSIGDEDDSFGGRVRYNVAVRDEYRNTLERADGYYVLDLRTWQGYAPLYLPYSKNYIKKNFSRGEIIFEYIQ